MKIKYVKLESPSGVPTYRRPTLIPGFPFDNTEIFRTLDRFMEDIYGSEQSSLITLMNQYDLVDFNASNKILGDFRMYQFRDLNSIRAIRYGTKDYLFNGSGQGMMSRIGNSYASYNMYENYHKLIDGNGNKIYEWNGVWNNSIGGAALNTLLENQFVKEDGTPTPFEVNKDYILGYYMASYDNIVSAGAADEIETKPLFADIPELAGQYSYIAYNPKTDGSHSIKTVCMLGLKFYNTDGTTSLFEAEADKPYSTVYGEYPFIPQGFSCVKFRPTKPYTKCCITRRIKNDLLTVADGYLEITYPFITPYVEPKMGSIDRKDILNNEVVLGGNYPEGTSKDPYVSYDLYTGTLPCDAEAGNLTTSNITGGEPGNFSLRYNIGSFTDEGLAVVTEKVSITENENTPAEVIDQVFGSKFKCYDVIINAIGARAESYISPGVDGFPEVDSGGCSGSGEN